VLVVLTIILCGEVVCIHVCLVFWRIPVPEWESLS
jgi:hypothetical protein